MSARYLLDTNICIYAASGRVPKVRLRLDLAAPGAVVISVIVYGELMFGIAKSSQPEAARHRLEALTQLAPIVPLPESASTYYGTIRAELERAGTPIGNNDLWIAAHAKALGLILVTNNEREFKRVKGLRVENWAK